MTTESLPGFFFLLCKSREKWAELSTSRLELLVGVSNSFIESQVNMKSRVSWVSVWENTYPEEN